jgi:hypothetical protein
MSYYSEDQVVRPFLAVGDANMELRLPLDIVHEIINFTDDKNTLVSLSHICQLVRPVAERRLYRAVLICHERFVFTQEELAGLEVAWVVERSHAKMEYAKCRLQYLIIVVLPRDNDKLPIIRKHSQHILDFRVWMDRRDEEEDPYETFEVLRTIIPTLVNLRRLAIEYDEESADDMGGEVPDLSGFITRSSYDRLNRLISFTTDLHVGEEFLPLLKANPDLENLRVSRIRESLEDFLIPDEHVPHLHSLEVRYPGPSRILRAFPPTSIQNLKIPRYLWSWGDWSGTRDGILKWRNLIRLQLYSCGFVHLEQLKTVLPSLEYLGIIALSTADVTLASPNSNSFFDYFK